MCRRFFNPNECDTPRKDVTMHLGKTKEPNDYAVGIVTDDDDDDDGRGADEDHHDIDNGDDEDPVVSLSPFVGCIERIRCRHPSCP